METIPLIKISFVTLQIDFRSFLQKKQEINFYTYRHQPERLFIPHDGYLFLQNLLNITSSSLQYIRTVRVLGPALFQERALS